MLRIALSYLGLYLLWSHAARAGSRWRSAPGWKAPGELEAKARLERVPGKYDLDDWLFTREVLVEQGAVPHSRPVLTLNARPGAGDAKLATSLHEKATGTSTRIQASATRDGGIRPAGQRAPQPAAPALTRACPHAMLGA